MFSHTKRIISILLILSMIFTSGGINTFAVSVSHYVDKVIENTQNNEVTGLDKSSWVFDSELNRYVVTDVNHALLSGWKYTNGANNLIGWRYFTPYGMPVIGWYTDINGYKYYFDENYIMVTGTIQIDGVVRQFDSNGRLIDNKISSINDSVNNKGIWFHEPLMNQWQYLVIQPDGIVSVTRNSWFLSDVTGTNEYYAVDKNGYLITGFVKYRGNIHYLSEKGSDKGQLLSNTIIVVNDIQIALDTTGKAHIKLEDRPNITVFDMDSLK